MYIIDNIVNTILEGHAIDELKKIPDESIDMIITSPPYWGLRNYNTKPQIWDTNGVCWDHKWEEYTRKGQTGGTKSSKVQIKGQENFQIVKDSKQYKCKICGAWVGELGAEPTFKDYIRHLLQIFEEVRRILKPSGSCWVNLGDGYSGSCQGAGADRTGTKQGTNRGTLYTSDKKFKSLLLNTGIAKKSLIGIPDRFKIAMIDNGWTCRNEIVWHKPNVLPTSVKDRFTVDFEKLYFFTKQGKYYFEQQKEPVKESSIKRINQSSFDKQTGGEKDYRKTKINTSRSARNTLENFKKNFDGLRNMRTVWSINTKGLKDAHFAIFPEELVRIPILATCPKSGIVLDMFFGSGTTGRVAKDLDRNFIGIELNKEYIEIANKRIFDT